MSNLIRTSGGRLIPCHRPDLLTLEETAHALANIGRFTGHGKKFYSVAQHAVLVSHLVEPQYAMAALKHDDAEATFNDISRPMKHRWWMFPYRILEAFAQLMIWRKYRCTPNAEGRREIKWADHEIAMLEKDALFETSGYIGTVSGSRILGPVAAERLYLNRHQELEGK